METILAIFALIVFMVLFALAVTGLARLLPAVFKGPGKIEKGILAIVAAIFLFD